MQPATIGSSYPEQGQSFFRDILEVARIYKTRMMHLLAVEKGHTLLRLSFQPVMTSIPAEGIRVTELAAGLGMSKQNCFQLLKQVEAAGYILRKDDTRDKRARNIHLTPRGIALLRDGIEITRRTDAECSQVVGEACFLTLGTALADLCRGLQLRTLARVGAHLGDEAIASSFSGDLILLAEHCNTSLMASTMARGYPALRPSYGQVLMHIGADGGRIQDIARSNDISKQAVGQLVGEIEQLGYIRRAPDPADGRGKILYLTASGAALIRDAMAAAEQLLQTYAEIIGATRLQQVQSTLSTLYAGLLGQRSNEQRLAPLQPALSAQAAIPPLYKTDLLQYLHHRLDNQGNNAGPPPVNSAQESRDASNLAAVEASLAAALGPNKLSVLQQILDQLSARMEDPEAQQPE